MFTVFFVSGPSKLEHVGGITNLLNWLEFEIVLHERTHSNYLLSGTCETFEFQKTTFARFCLDFPTF